MHGITQKQRQAAARVRMGVSVAMFVSMGVCMAVRAVQSWRGMVFVPVVV